MAFFNYPFHVTKDTAAVASEVQTNFDEVLAWIMSNLIQKDGTVAMTGPLVLAPGDPGAPGHAANKAYVDSTIPVGVIWEYGGTTLPANWLWCNGDTYTNTSQPKLYNAIARSFTAAGVAADSFQVPDKRKRFSVGADATEAALFGLGKTGGQRNSELLSHAHTSSGSSGPVSTDHTHGISFMSGPSDRSLAHNHGGTTDTRGSHGHGQGQNPVQFYYVLGGQNEGVPGPGSAARTNSFVWDGDHAHNFSTNSGAAPDHLHAINGNTSGISANHNHAITVTVNANGAGTTLVDKNLPPYVVVNYIIYAGAA